MDQGSIHQVDDDLTIIVMPRTGTRAAMEEESGGVDGGADGVAGIRFLSGACPDPKCQTRLYCMSSYQSIECTGCGQLHAQSALQNMKEEKGDIYNTALFAIKSLIAGIKPEPGTDNVKVHGLSNYLCKLLSHLLSRYGMDKSSGHAKLLTEMGQPEIFDCGVLCDRAFHIDPEHLNITGYGRDRSGSVQYLSDTLNVAREKNDNEDRLIPIHADGDGHCLVHAISRALVGRELFWHPLRLNLMQHFQKNLERYKDHFKNFVDVDEWEDIVNECQPIFVPKDGEAVGLRNIHIFGLANVLKRPIILLDSLSGISSSADYSGVFLPAMLKPDQCKNKDGVLNFPLCIAWSSQGRNHFIPLVGIKDRPCPRLPRYMLQGTWGVHPSELDKYIAFDDQGCCSIGGPRCLHENYIQRLVSAMEEVFYTTHKVHPALVAEVHQYIFRPKGFVGLTLDMVIDKTYHLVKNRALMRCLQCRSLTALEITQKMLNKGGHLYQLALKEIGELNTSKMYTFTDYRVSCRYNAVKDCLVPDITQISCPFCQSELKFRYMNADSSIEYHEGDVTVEPAGPNARCQCGFKHYYNGKFYDNRPREIPVPLEWGGKTQLDVVQWWENESDPQLNSNVYQVAQDLVLKHFPGEFGIERLQQKIVSAILTLTASKDKKEVAPCDTPTPDSQAWNAEEASKIILSGFQRQGIHKEELTKSEAERQVKKKIEANAPQQQAKKTTTAAEPSTSSAAASKRNSPIRTSLTKTRASAMKASSSAPSTPSRQAGTSSPQSATPPSTPKVAAKEKKIRVVAAGGSSETVTLPEDVTFSQLQEVVFKATKIPAEHQKLRLGFPPKVLTTPDPGQEDKVVPINHGDKISVENTAIEPQAVVKEPAGSSSWSSPRSSVRGHVDARMPSEDALLNALSARYSGGDSLDHSLISLGILAETVGVDLWSLVQSQPHHFSPGGLYYRQAQRDVGLVADKHFTFPVFPGKTFCYNAILDRVELCLDDLGHFEVEADVEKKAHQRERTGTQHSHHHTSAPSSGKIRREDPNRASFGSSGAITKHISSQHAFEGHGHSLRDPAMDDKMPQDVPLTENIHGAARRLQDFCDPEHNRSCIEEEPEKMETEKMETETTGSKAEGQEDGYVLPKYTRKGPGFSVLEPAPPAPPPAAASLGDSQAVQELFTTTVRSVMDIVSQEAGGEAEGEGSKDLEKEGEKDAMESQSPAQPSSAAEETGVAASADVPDDAMETT